LIWTAISLLVSGLWWLYVLRIRPAQDAPGPINLKLAQWHALSALAAVYAFGVVSAKHIARGWALRERVYSGIAVCALFAVLALSGFALAYLLPETWHVPVGWAHATLGVLAFALGAMHRR
jgi:hypothetical protein